MTAREIHQHRDRQRERADSEGTPDDPDEAPAEGGDEGDERPPIDDEERADVDLAAISEEINEEDGGDDPPEEGSESPDETNPDDTQTEGDEKGEETHFEGGSWGEMYVEILAVLLPEITEEMSGEPSEMTSEDVAELATQQPVELDAKFDAVVEDMGGMEEMSDKQALLLSTAIVCGTVLVKEGDVAGDLVGTVREGVSA